MSDFGSNFVDDFFNGINTIFFSDRFQAPLWTPPTWMLRASFEIQEAVRALGKTLDTITLPELQAIAFPIYDRYSPADFLKFTTEGRDAQRDEGREVIDDVTGIINDSIDNAGQVVDELTTIIGDYVEDAVGDIVGVINDATGGIVGRVLDGINQGRDIITNVLDGIEGAISEGRGILDDIFSIVSGRVDLEITNVINIPSDVFEAVVGGIGDILDNERQRMDSVLGTVVDGITGIFTDVVEEQARSTITIATSIDEQTQVQEESADELLEEVKEINNETINGTGASMATGAGAVITEAVNRSDVGLPESWTTGFKIDRGLDCNEADLEDWIKEKGIISGTSGALVFEIMQVVGKAMGLLSIGGALSAKELYEFSMSCAWEILEPGDAVVAYQRRLITQDNLNDELRMRGYNQDRVDVLIETGYQVPDPASLYSMNLRGLPGGENLTDRFKDLGFNPTDAQSLSDLKFYIPGAQDLITMAVRDVFNPAIVEEFGQDQDFPEEFGTYAAQQGISDFWARKYWAAHWVLPSMQMGFEMLHRRVIDEDKLKRLMAAQDIMPGWRDDLIAISYRPYTRVDIRRMHDTGVLSEDEVYDAYRDIGYNDERARTLTDFTVELNRDDPDPLEPLDGLTRSAVISAYKDGLIDRITAEGLLEAEGVGPDARLIYLNDAELDIEKELRNDQSQTLLIEYENAAISLRSAVASLRALPLTPLEQEKVELKLRRITAKRTKLPSKADLQKLYKNSIIGKGTFKDEMERLGYPDRWVDDYIKLVKLGIPLDDEPAA